MKKYYDSDHCEIQEEYIFKGCIFDYERWKENILPQFEDLDEHDAMKVGRVRACFQGKHAAFLRSLLGCCANIKEVKENFKRYFGSKDLLEVLKCQASELQEKSPGYSEEKAIEYMSNDHLRVMMG